MVKKVEDCSQYTKEDSSDAKAPALAQQRRSYESNAKALRRKKVSIPVSVPLHVPILLSR